MKAQYFVCAIIVALGVGCTELDADGFTTLSPDFRYKLISLGDEGRPCNAASFVSFQLSVFDAQDSCIAIKRFDRIRPDDASLSKELRKLLSQCKEGDSVLIQSSSSGIGLENILRPEWVNQAEKTWTAALKISEAISDLEYRNLRAQERMLADAELKEHLMLEILKDSLQLKDEEYVDGIYFRLIKPGKGKKPTSGANITVHYTAHFADGSVFDNTYEGNALQYQCGKPDQVLPGFAIGMARMHEGEEAMFVIPSHLAFGELGSSSKIVPPYTTLIYNVRLVKVGG